MVGEQKLIIILRFSVKFVASGLMRREYDGIKLHLTLINTLFGKEQGDWGTRTWARRGSPLIAVL